VDARTVPIALKVNGRPLTLHVHPHHTLLAVLRDQVELTGTKECCAEGECGACTILMNGRAVNACLVLGVEADGQEIVTIEGLAADGQLSPIQNAFLEHGAVQCGFCIPGMIMAASALLAANPDPSVVEIQNALAGNLCRCAGYSRIVAAVRSAAGMLTKQS
jgi:aerobic-type carbon monoxide dehydrogenase small subunit (CoxS/CutS family)